MILVVHAHPYPSRSRSTAALLRPLEDLPGIEIRRLYDLYPDFDIDVPAEQAALARAELVVWLHPVYWYTVPGLLKHWFDRVLARGWAYGEGGTALAGKRCLWAASAGGGPKDYSPSGGHRHPFDAFVPVVEMTARYCGMTWLEPFIVHDATARSDAELRERGEALRARVASAARGAA